MYDTGGTHSVRYAAPADRDLDVRLDWLRDEIRIAESPDAAVRARELQRALSIVEPVSTEQSYAKFGACLGLFPPFAIFARILFSAGSGFKGDALAFWGMLFLGMNVVCVLVGWQFAKYLGRKLGDPRAWSWADYVPLSLLLGLLWGLVTGAAGGAVGFGVGAVVGVVCAVPVALAAFPVFAVLHRIQSHGGMIEERDLRPLAFGIPLTAAALIMSVGVK